MNWYNFIFSEKKAARLRRHLVFWLLWALYFTTSYFHYEQAGLKQVQFEAWNAPFFMKALSLLLVHAAACYFFTGYIMQQFLFKRSYFRFAISVICLSAIIVGISYIVHQQLFSFINSAFHYKPKLADQNILWTSIASGLLSAPKIICAAAAVKMLKRWWLQQKEKEKLEKEKLLTDLQLLKSQIHPEFLFSSLDSIGHAVQKKDIDKAAASLLKLADVLSYMLYETDNSFVPLDKEIKTIKDYVLMQKNKMGHRLEIDIAIKGETSSKMIAPLLLFSFIENSFSFFENQRLETAWITIELQVEGNRLIMKLIHSKTNDPAVESSNHSFLVKAGKRLQFFYEGNYTLKTTVESEMMMTHLKILVHERNEQIITYSNKETIYATN